MKRFFAALALVMAAGQAFGMGYHREVAIVNGGVVPGATITVYLRGTQTFADIFSDSSGTVESNPFSTDELGRYGFWAAPGDYSVRVSGSGFAAYTYLAQIAVPDTFDVTDAAYGAVSGDDLDDSAAFQACLDELESAGAGAMIIPAGSEFNIDSVVHLPSNVTITGGGKIISGVTRPGVLYGFVFTAFNEENIVVEDIEIDGASTRSGYNGSGYIGLMYFSGCTNVTIRDCYLHDSDSDGVLFEEYVSGTHGPNYSVSVTGNLIERCHRDGVALCSNIGAVVASNRIIDCWGEGIDIEPYYTAPTARPAKRTVITGNYVYSSQDGVWTGWEPTTQSKGLGISGEHEDGVVIDDIVVVGNHFESYTANQDPASTAYVREVAIAYATEAAADSVFGGTLIFSNNVVKTNRISAASPSHGLVSVRTNVRMVFTGNTIDGSWDVNSGGSWGINRAVSILGDSADGSYIFDPIISDNSVRGCFQIGIHLGRIRNAVLDGNLIRTDQPDTGVDTGTYGLRLYDVDGVTVTGGSIHVAGYPLYITGEVGVEENDITLTGVNLHSRRLSYITRIESNAVINGLSLSGCRVNQLRGPVGGENVISTLALVGAVLNGYRDVGTTLDDGGSAATGSRQLAIDVRDYGANGNDSNSDTVAVQAAIDAAELHGSCYVDFPSGVFRVDAVTVEGDGIILRGAGTGTEADSDEGTLIRPHTALAGDYLLTIGSAARTTYRSGATGIKFHYGSGYICQSLVRMVNSRNGLIRDCVFYLNASYADGNSCLVIDAVDGNDSTGNVIDNCHFNSTRYVTGGGAGYGYGVQILCPGSIYGSYNTANLFSNCKFYNPATASSSGGAIYTSGDDVGANSFVNCHIGMTSTGTPGGVKLYGLSGGEMMVNCTIDGDGGETVLEFGDLGSGATASYFIGNIDGVWTDANNIDDEKATVIDNADDSQFNTRALRLIPRSAAPASPTEGDIYYDSDDDTVYVRTGAGAWAPLN